MKSLLIILFFLPSLALGAGPVYYADGAIEDVLIRKSLSAYAIIYIKGFSSAGQCEINANKDLVVLSIANDERAESIYSMTLSAYMSGKPVKVRVHEGVADTDGFCEVLDMRLNPTF